MHNKLYAEAEPLARRNLTASREALGNRHIESLMAQLRLAESLLDPTVPLLRAVVAEAETILADTATSMRQVLGPDNPCTQCAVKMLDKARRELKFRDSRAFGPTRLGTGADDRPK